MYERHRSPEFALTAAGKLAAFAQSLGGSIVTLPAAHAPADVKILVRRGSSDPAKVRLESIAFAATHVARPIQTAWPSAPFSCTRAQYRGGELVFFDGDAAFGFGVDAKSPVTVSTGDVERHLIGDIGSHDALTQLALLHALDVQPLDPAEPSEVSATAATTPQVAAPSVATLERIAPRPIGVPSPAMAVVIAIFGLAIAFVGVYVVAAPKWLSTFVTVCGGIVFAYGALVALLGKQRSRRLHEAILIGEQRTPAIVGSGFGLVVGVALIVWGIDVAAPSVRMNAPQFGLEGLVLLAAGALVSGFFAARIALRAE
jgi:hypothetical protein